MNGDQRRLRGGTRWFRQSQHVFLISNIFSEQSDSVLVWDNVGHCLQQ